ncbi:MAG TPA: LytR C-terminal domain-containing protein, partial [Actinomycetota bacterium]|nr:LytR C-terminal domain-containing protein [Actinomycetota bacterium]
PGLKRDGADRRRRSHADRLSELGYEVVAIEGSSKQYPATTVFWSHPRAQDAAEALAERFGWLAQPKPANLSATVDIHVVVGSDEA